MPITHVTAKDKNNECIAEISLDYLHVVITLLPRNVNGVLKPAGAGNIDMCISMDMAYLLQEALTQILPDETEE